MFIFFSSLLLANNLRPKSVILEALLHKQLHHPNIAEFHGIILSEQDPTNIGTVMKWYTQQADEFLQPKESDKEVLEFVSWVLTCSPHEQLSSVILYSGPRHQPRVKLSSQRGRYTC